MCDFRTIKKIQLTDGTIIQNPLKGYIDPYGLCDSSPDTYKSRKDVKDPGLYFICASGSYHQYFDGENWLFESCDDIFKYNPPDKGWTVLEYTDNCVFH